MKSPYGLQIIENCLSCPLHRDKVFCDLTPEAKAALASISSTATYPKGAVLFVEGQASRGIFVVCSGRVKLTMSSAQGKSLILRICEAGEVIGLPGTISGEPYEATAEVLEPSQTNFIGREPLLRFLKTHGEAALRVAEVLSRICHSTYQEVRNVGLSYSAAGKLAQFLLMLQVQNDSPSGLDRAHLTLTHEEIAEKIGATRETVTRTFTSLKQQHLLEVHGATIVIKNRTALQELAQS